MYYTVKTLLGKGESIRAISRALHIHRRTVRRIKSQIAQGGTVPVPVRKPKLLDAYSGQIKTWISQGKSSVLIHEQLVVHKGIAVSYPTVVKYVSGLKGKEVYVPLLAQAGEEAQVDFGYLGKFVKDGTQVKAWVFSMVLSHSRYSYHEIVTDQKTATFIACHMRAFEYFGGAPATVKIDNLKSGVITPSFYEPVIQHQYASFLAHYGSSPITARIRRGQDKGKVEQGVKYVKNNFLKRIDHRDYHRAQKDLGWWTGHICNQRTHGTTRKVPAHVFGAVEKAALHKLPAQRYEIFTIENRKANAFAHVSFRYNYYSVPHTYAGMELVLQSNGSTLKVYNGQELIATHAIGHGQGVYITKGAHKPPIKQKKPRGYYLEQMTAIGESALQFMLEAEALRPRHWHEMAKGIIQLSRQHGKQVADASCKRALAYGAVSYNEVKNIVEKKLYTAPPPPPALPGVHGYGHDLGKYDKLIY